MKKLNIQAILKADKDVHNDPSYGPEEELIDSRYSLERIQKRIKELEKQL